MNNIDSPIWTMRNKEKINISDMTNNHLHNTYLLVKRQGNKKWVTILSNEIELRQRSKQQELKLSYLIF